MLELLRETGLLSGKTLGVDATTLEANAAMRSIVRRDDGTGYEEWLEQVARASGIGTPTREDLAKLDRKRPRKGSNKDWVHPHDPESRIAKMKGQDPAGPQVRAGSRHGDRGGGGGDGADDGWR